MEESREDRVVRIGLKKALEILNQRTGKRGRPSTGFDKRAYMKEYMRKRRAKSIHTPYPVDENTTTK